MDKRGRYEYNMDDLYKITIESLEKRGVVIMDIAEIVLTLQKPYKPKLKIESCIESVKAVISKRESIHTILTGIAIDEMCEKKLLSEPIQSIINDDKGLYGVDEILALGIVNLYGSIGLTNFGYLDKEKNGIIKELDSSEENVNTFLDDIIAAIAAAASSRIAHDNKEE